MSAEYNAKFANTDIATRAIHAGQEPDPTTGAVVTPIFATSTFKQDGVLGLRGGHDYSRSINPTRTSFDEQLAAVEGGKYALSFSSGLAAIDVLLRSTIKPGDNILLGNDVYGGTYRLLSKVFVPWGVGLDVVNITDLKAVETALASKHYQYVWVETPSNPLLNITDIAATTEVAHKYGTKVAVDNTFASPAKNKIIRPTQKAPPRGSFCCDKVRFTKRKRRLWASFSFGEPSGIRTPGPLIKSQMLCRLS